MSGINKTSKFKLYALTLTREEEKFYLGDSATPLRFEELQQLRGWLDKELANAETYNIALENEGYMAGQRNDYNEIWNQNPAYKVGYYKALLEKAQQELEQTK